MLQETFVVPVKAIPEIADRGLEFEKFVVSRFNPAQFRQLDSRSPAIYPPSPNDPRLMFRPINRKSYFAVECRFRQMDYRNKFTWAETYQLMHYQQFQQKTQMPLFVVIGLGGLPSKPTNVYIIPFDSISNTTTLELCQFRANERSNADAGFFFDAAVGKLK